MTLTRTTLTRAIKEVNIIIMDFKDKLSSSGNLLKIAVNDFVQYMEQFHDELQAIKGEAVKPNRRIALALLEYISWENHKYRATVDALCGIQLEKHMDWVNAYCSEYKCTQEQALKRIIEGSEEI